MEFVFFFRGKKGKYDALYKKKERKEKLFLLPSLPPTAGTTAKKVCVQDPPSGRKERGRGKAIIDSLAPRSLGLGRSRDGGGGGCQNMQGSCWFGACGGGRGGLYLNREEGVNRSFLTDSRKKETKIQKSAILLMSDSRQR